MSSATNCIFAHRRDACAAKPSGRSAQFDDATDEIDEDLEDRDELSESIDSGEDLEEVDDVVLAERDRRAGVENASALIDGGVGVGAQLFQPENLSNVDLARQLSSTCAIA